MTLLIGGSCLKFFGFGNDVCRWVDTFYNYIKLTIIVNGHTTQCFNIQRGCRQGDPISPYFFVLCVDILAIMIREDTDIKGININKVEHTISQFADDAQLMNYGDRTSFEISIHVVNKFGSVSAWSVHECRQNTRHMVRHKLKSTQT